MRIFDTHTHIFPDSIAERVLAHLREKSHFIPTFTLGTYDDLKQRALKAGYSGWLNCPVVTRPGQARSVNEWVASRNQWPTLSLGGIHPKDEDREGILRHLKDLGLHGVKFHPEYQEFDLLDSEMEVIWSNCENLGLPVLIHGGQDIGFEPPFHSCPRDFAELSRRHPGLVIVAAHCGGWRLWDEVEEELPGSGVYIDTSFTIPYLQDKSQFLRLVRKVGTKNVLFGTDSPWQDLEDAVGQVSHCGLSQDELEDVFWNNARRVWKAIPELP